MRLNVSVPDCLVEQVRTALPDLNVSAVLQEALRSMLSCRHERTVCGDCGDVVDAGGAAVAKFYAELLWAWEPLVDRGGTAEGAARVAKSVAVEMGVPGAETKPLPRPPRAMRRAS